MRDLITTISIDVAVIFTVLFGELQKGLNLVLVSVTIIYTIAKIYVLYKNNKNEK